MANSNSREITFKKYVPDDLDLELAHDLITMGVELGRKTERNGWNGWFSKAVGIAKDDHGHVLTLHAEKWADELVSRIGKRVA